MLKINKYFSLVLVAVIAITAFSSCEQREDWRFPELGNGGFVKFVSAPEFDAGADPASASFSALTEDPNQNIATYSLRVKGDFTGATADTIAFRSTTTFPFDVGFTGADMASLFGVDISTFAEGDSFEFFGTVTTVDGVVYDYVQSACSDCPTEPGDPNGSGTWNGGTTDQVLLSAAGLLQAFNYEVTFDDPPAP